MYVLVVIFIFYIHSIYCSDNIVSLNNKKDLQTLIYDTNDAYFVRMVLEEHSDEQQAKAFENMASTILDKWDIKAATISCNSKANMKICQELVGTQSMNSLRLFIDEPVRNPYTGNKLRSGLPFEGGSDNRSLEKFLLKSIPGLIEKVETSEKINEIISKSFDKDRKLVLTLFTDKSAISPMFKNVCFRSRHDASCVQVNKASENLITKYAITSYPTLAIISKDDKVESFTGDIKDANTIVNWLVEKKSVYIKEEDSDKPSDKSSNSNPSSSSSDHMTPKELVHDMKSAGEDIVYVITSTESMDQEVEGLNSAKKRCGGAVRCVQLNCGEDTTISSTTKELCAAPYPRISVIAMEDEEVQNVASLGEATSLALDLLPEDSVLELYDGPGALEGFIQMSMQGGIDGSPAQFNKVGLIALSDKDTAPTMLRNIAVTFKDKANVGFMSSPSLELLASMGNPRLPTVVALFPKPADEPSSEGISPDAMQFAMQPYMPEAFGKLSFRGIYAFMKNMLVATGLEDMPGRDTFSNEPSDSSSSLNTTPVFKQLKDSSDWEKECGNEYRALCVIVFLQEGFGEETVSDAIQLLSTQGMAGSFRFLWSDIVCRPSFAAGFGVSADSAPRLLAYSPSKGRFATHYGAFDSINIKDFLVSVASGRTSTGPLSERPIFEDSCDMDEIEIAGDGDSIEDADDLLAEIRAEEEARAQAIRDELEQERLQREAEATAKIDAEAAAKKKKKRKKKKKKTSA